MEGREEKKLMIMIPSSPSTQLTNAVTADDSESFYMKLTELLKSTGLNLILNVRETFLDLYLLYLEVTKRGGYHQVTDESKWAEVASALKLEGSNAPEQLSSLYGYLLYRYEKLYFYRSPQKQATTTSTNKGLLKRKRNSVANEDNQTMTNISEDCSTKMAGLLKRKRNSVASLSPLMDNEDNRTVTNISEDCSIKMAGTGSIENRVLLHAASNEKKKKKRGGAPSGYKSAYHIFLKQECARLKTCRRDLDGRAILGVAIDAWNTMSKTEKQPYVEESKKWKEKSNEAMITQEKQQSMEDRNKCEEMRPNVCGETGDYCVTSQPEVYQSVVNKAEMDIALEIAENASNGKDPLFLLDWDSYGSLDLAPAEYK